MTGIMTLFISVQIWTLFVCVTIFLSGGRQQSNPSYWIWAIIISLTPIIFSPALISIDPINNVISKSAITDIQMLGQLPASDSKSISWPSVFARAYIFISLFLIIRRLIQWRQLSAMKQISTPNSDIFISSSTDTPIAIGWPARCVVLPEVNYSDNQLKWIIRHEREHLRHFDPETTIILLLIQDVFWINPALSWLVSAWRNAIEIRADFAVIKDQNLHDRKAYAEFLLTVMRQSKNGRTLPCPSANLNSNRVRSVKMRLSHILDQSRHNRKQIPKTASALIKIFSLISGVLVVSCAVSPPSKVDLQPLNKYPPIMPKKCPGLESSLIKIKDFTSNFNGEQITYRGAEVGNVLLKFDVNNSGETKNIHLVESNHACFEQASINSVAKWVYKPNEPAKGIQTRITFRLTEHDNDDVSLEEQLMKFTQP